MTVTINESDVTIASDNLAGATAIKLFYSLNCGEEEENDIDLGDVVDNSFTFDKDLGDGVHFFRLLIAGGNPASEVTTKVITPTSWACEVAKTMDLETMLKFYLIDNLTCECTPDDFCTIYDSIITDLDEC